MLRFPKSKALQPTDFGTRDDELVKLNPGLGGGTLKTAAVLRACRAHLRFRLTKPSRPDESGLGTTALG
jgi:hypothetical protein